MHHPLGFLLLFLGLCLNAKAPVATAQIAPNADNKTRWEKLGAKMVADKQGNIIQFTLNDCSQLTAEDYKAIGQLTELKQLTLYGKCNGLNDETLPYFANLKKLEKLGTDGMRLSDAAFVHFAPMTALQSLSLFHVSFQLQGFTGVGFRHLKDCPNLKSLTFGGTTAGDAAIEALTEVKQLRDLRFWHIWAGPDCAKSLEKMPYLTFLKIGQSLPRYDGKPRQFTFTAATLPTFLKMTDLETLHIEEAKLTVEQLSQLAGHPKLKKLILKQMLDFSQEDAQLLEKKLGKIKVEFTPMTPEEKTKLERLLAETKPKK